MTQRNALNVRSNNMLEKQKTKLAKQNTYSCILLALPLVSFTELPKFTSDLMVVILTNFLLGLQYRILAQHRITYQSIQLNSCHHSVNQNILLKIQNNLLRISRDCIYQGIVTNWYHLMYNHYSPTCHQITLYTLYCDVFTQREKLRPT